jgi:hypothetical protein
VAGGWWLVAGGWWLVAGGWWLVKIIMPVLDELELELIMSDVTRMQRWLLPVALLLIYLLTRLPGLAELPLHNDEGLHLTRAVEVWNGHPFWAISDGKIINHWPIALLDPRHAPIYAGRLPTLLIGMIGLAAGYGLVRRLVGEPGAVLAAALWIGTPYLFFFERLAFSDAEAGALVVVALWAAYRISTQSQDLLQTSRGVEGQKGDLTQSGKDAKTQRRNVGTPFMASAVWQSRDAAFVGVSFTAALMFKFTAAPYALAVALALWVMAPPQRRFQTLLVAGVTGLICLLPPVIYLMLRGDDFFSIALGWIGAGGGAGGQASLVGNLERLWLQLIGYGSITWVLVLGAGLGLVVWGAIRGRARAHRRGPLQVSIIAAVVPLAIMLVLGREVLARHFVVALPLLMVVAASGLGLGLNRIRNRASRWMATGFGAAALVLGIAPFLLIAYGDPSSLPLPADVRYEHIAAHPSGYGLREAVRSLGEWVTRPNVPVIASMFPDSCRRANFEAQGIRLICTDAPGIEAINSSLREHGAVYVLTDTAPLIGIDVTTLAARATRLAVFPRPGETEAEASVVLWELVAP